MKPDDMPQERYEYLLACGWTDEEVPQKWEDEKTMARLHAERQGRPEREITSSTYERAQKRLQKDVENWIGKR